MAYGCCLFLIGPLMFIYYDDTGINNNLLLMLLVGLLIACYSRTAIKV